jgi:hypothetical protein
MNPGEHWEDVDGSITATQGSIWEGVVGSIRVAQGRIGKVL